MTKKLKPACFQGFPLAVTNQGVLIPCCYCDDKPTLEDPKFKKLMAVSKLDDNKSIKQILRKREWSLFFRNLKKHKGPEACMETCAVKGKDD
jgi:hypothetical protein